MQKLKSKIESLNLDFSKEMMKLGTINLILIVGIVVLSIFKFNVIAISLLLGALVIFNYFFLTRYSKIEKEKKVKLDESFIEVFSFLRIYLSNKETVYHSLNEVKAFADSTLEEKLELLINQIDEDKSIKPYIEFASIFQDKVIEEVMIALYEITNSGSSDIYLNQFNKIFEELKTRIENEKSYKRIKFFDNLNIFSIVGSGIIMVTLSFAVISLLGGIING